MESASHPCKCFKGGWRYNGQKMLTIYTKILYRWKILYITSIIFGPKSSFKNGKCLLSKFPYLNSPLNPKICYEMGSAPHQFYPCALKSSSKDGEGSLTIIFFERFCAPCKFCSLCANEFFLATESLSQPVTVVPSGSAPTRVTPSLTLSPK
jgi:hypothetical protein